MKENNACIFCFLAHNLAKDKIVYESDRVISFLDANPRAKTHALLIPKLHVDNLILLQEEDRPTMSDLIMCLPKVAKILNLQHFKVHINNGKESGQEIMHIHFHILAN